MATKRTDLHRPSAIIPADYNFVGCDYHGASACEESAFASDRMAFRKWMERTGAKFAHIERDRGGCDVCGAYCSYIARFHHVPTNTVITTGWDCAEKFGIDDPNAFKSFRKKIKLGIEAATGKRKAQRLLADKGLTAAWEIFVTPYVDLPRSTRRHHENEAAYEEATIVDIVRKVVGWGSLSDAQASFIAALLARIPQRNARDAERKAQQAADAAAASPVPVTEKRVDITGKVLSTREQDSDFGTVTKVLVQVPEGFKLWGTLPRELHDVTRGATIAFSARIERSKDDEKFGFFSRPTKARLIQAAPAGGNSGPVSEAVAEERATVSDNHAPAVL